ncbi:MAG: NADH-quinone oxidoreductase subunit I, partial [Cutibacterium acnes]|nr:NADH-quinone oxidoreductase subunit I [Cutibacterium acnes]
GLPPSGQDDVRTGPANSGATAHRDDDNDTQHKDEEAA